MFVCYSYQPITSLTGEFLTSLVGGEGGGGGGSGDIKKRKRKQKREKASVSTLPPLSAFAVWFEDEAG